MDHPSLTVSNFMAKSIDLQRVNPLPHRDTFANRADPDQAALARAA